MVAPNSAHRHAKVIAFANQKGGVCKTSTLVNVAAALAERGRKVLVWDVDVNAGATRLYGIPDGVLVYGTYEVMVGDVPAAEVIVRRGDLDVLNLPENVDLIVADEKLAQVERRLMEEDAFMTPQEALSEPVNSLRGDYDYILMDTSPSMNAPTKAAYMAVDYMVLTAVPEPLAIEGLVHAIKYVGNAKKRGNPKLSMLGVVMNQVPGRTTNLSRALMAEVDKNFGPGSGLGPAAQRFETSISASTVVPSVQREGKTLFEAMPDHKVSHQYRELAMELEGRLAMLDVPAALLEREKRSDPSLKEVANG